MAIPRKYGRYGAYAAGYGAASRYMPGTTTAGTMAAGAYAGSLAAPIIGRSAGRFAPRGRLGGGIAGAAAGYALAKISRGLFGKSNNRSTSMRSNYGYR